MNTLSTKFPRWLAALGLVAALSGVAPVLAQGAGSSTVTATLPAGGGWMAYRLPYAGNGAQLGVTLTYSPADGFTASNGAVTLDAYSPNDLPPGGLPIGSATPSGLGSKYWQLGSAVGGDYILIVHNWDPRQRPVTIDLSTTEVSSGATGPGLILLSSSAGAVVSASSAPSPTTAPATAPATPPVAPAASTVSDSLPLGGWVAYSFPYPGDSSNVGVTLTFSPLTPFSTAAGAIALEAYSPNNPPPNGHPIGQASWVSPGVLYWQLSSSTGGTYVFVIHNWDPLDGSISIQVSTSQVASGSAGPGLTKVSAGR